MAQSAVETMSCCPLLILFTGQRVKYVNRSGADVQFVSCHRYLVIFHPFVQWQVVNAEVWKSKYGNASMEMEV